MLFTGGPGGSHPTLFCEGKDESTERKRENAGLYSGWKGEHRTGTCAY